MKLNGTRLINARHQKGLNQRAVADACGVSLVTISNAEHGKEVYPATGKKICEFLEIDLAETVLPVQEREGDGDAA
jgi:transcriptional regulator with XRE-family HTH domain